MSTPAGAIPVLDAAVGLAQYEAEGTFSLSLVRHGRITPETTWELKCQALAKSELLLICLHDGNYRHVDVAELRSGCL